MKWTPDLDRKLLALRRWGLTYDLIAFRFSVSRGAVAGRLFRLRSQLDNRP